MNYEEAIDHSFKVRWKTSTCSAGEKCWCRIIEPEEPIMFDGDEELYIAGSGSMPREYAEYIVELHNKSLQDG